MLTVVRLAVHLSQPTRKVTHFSFSKCNLLCYSYYLCRSQPHLSTPTPKRCLHYIPISWVGVTDAISTFATLFDNQRSIKVPQPRERGRGEEEDNARGWGLRGGRWRRWALGDRWCREENVNHTECMSRTHIIFQISSRGISCVDAVILGICKRCRKTMKK